jgi:Ca2+-binding EF-hand superfamily protein
MTREELKDALTVAGTKHDGHITNGSLEELVKVVDLYVVDILECYAFPDVPKSERTTTMYR